MPFEIVDSASRFLINLNFMAMQVNKSNRNGVNILRYLDYYNKKSLRRTQKGKKNSRPKNNFDVVH